MGKQSGPTQPAPPPRKPWSGLATYQPVLDRPRAPVEPRLPAPRRTRRKILPVLGIVVAMLAVIAIGVGAVWDRKSGNLEAASKIAKTPGVAPAPVSHPTRYALGAGSEPFAIASLQNDVYVTNTGADRVTKISASGVVTVFRLPARADPRGIAVGADHNLWIAAHGARAIVKMTPAGAMTSYRVAGNPYAVTLGPDHNVWFTIPANNIVASITPAGAIHLYPIPAETNVGALSITAGPDGNLWVAENTAGVVARISTSGFVKSFKASFGAPNAITTSADAIWFTEDAEHVARMSTNGSYKEFSLSKLPVASADANKTARAIASHNGVVWCAMDDGNIIRVTNKGEITRYVTGAQIEPAGLTFDAHGNLWLADWTGGAVFKLPR